MDSTPPATNYKCFVCGISPPHPIDSCEAFLSLALDEREAKVREQRRCFRCLTGKHNSRDCHRKGRCTVEGCKKRHHHLLHGMIEKEVSFDLPEGDSASGVGDTSGTQTVGCCAVSKISVCSEVVLHRVLPVRLIGPGGKSFEGHAFLDPGANSTLIKKSTARILGLKGETTRVKFGMFNGDADDAQVEVVSVGIQSVDGKATINVDHVFTVEHIAIPPQDIDWPTAKKQWAHLADIELPPIRFSEPDILVGIDAIEAHLQLDIRSPGPFVKGPIAIRTPFGWSVAGPVDFGGGARTTNPRTSIACISAKSCPNEEFEKVLKANWEIEAYGAANQKETVWSVEDERALQFLESSWKVVNGQLEIGLLLKNPSAKFPSTRQIALRRFKQLQNRFKRDPVYAEKYRSVIERYIKAGYARSLTEEELKLPSWMTLYLIHHGVRHPFKPDKLRIVMDASFECEGISLNNQMLKGPNLVPLLPSALLKFREGLISLQADIADMYFLVKVPPQQQQLQRFFWEDEFGRLRENCMAVHIFGSRSAAATCQFALQKAMELCIQDFPEGLGIVKEKFYVDNYLDSVDSLEEALYRMRKLIECFARFKFRLTKWSSSDRRILSELPKEELAEPKLDLDLDRLPVERIMGLNYDAEEDCFFVRVRILEQVSTKRQLIAQTASIFDPTLFLGPVTFAAKELIQDAWRTKGLGWDDVLPLTLQSRFTKWAKDLCVLESLRVARCYRNKSVPLSHRELHVFVFGSPAGRAAVAYYRFVYADGSVQVSFVLAKSRVAPLNAPTAVRMDAEAARLGSRLAASIIRDAAGISLKSVTFWSSSAVMFDYLHTVSTSFYSYMDHCISDILSMSKREQWRFLPPQLNSARYGVSNVRPKLFTASHAWISGPSFLLQPVAEWPMKRLAAEPSENDEEVSQVFSVNASTSSVSETHHFLNRCIERISALNKIKRVAAQVLRACAKFSSLRRKSVKIEAVADLSPETAGHAPAVPSAVVSIPDEQSPVEGISPVQFPMADSPCVLAGHAPAGLASVGHVPIDSSSVGHASDDRTSVGHAPINRSSNGHAPLSRSSVGHAPAGHLSVGNESAEQVAPDLAALDCDRSYSQQASAGEEKKYERSRHADSSCPDGFGSVKDGPASVAELDYAFKSCIRQVQKAAFPSELKSLRRHQVVHSSSKLISLSPFLDEEGIIRVGGRLEDADFCYSRKHQILLPKSGPLVTRIVWHFHSGEAFPPLKGSHKRGEALFAELRSQFWILGGRRAIKTIISSCLWCRRLYAQPQVPNMSSLPSARLGPRTYAFVNTGVDCLGPFYVAVGRRTEKRWISLFTCLVSRGISLEEVHKMDESSFLMAYSRFEGDRGRPKTMWSDNGTNFTAGEKEMREGLDRILNSEKVRNFLVDRGIEWHFSPPTGPHFGGAWEKLVSSTKNALKATLGNRCVDEEVFRTVIKNVQALVNSRPLTHLSVDPNDPEPLTPNHFIHGRAFPHIPLDLVSEEDINSRTRHLAAQAYLDFFWERWLDEYAPYLTKRGKWTQQRRNVRVDDIVLIVDSRNLRGQWPLGRVIEVMPGKDGKVRVVRVKTNFGEYVRPVAKLCVLLTTGEEDSAQEEEGGAEAFDSDSDEEETTARAPEVSSPPPEGYTRSGRSSASSSPVRSASSAAANSSRRALAPLLPADYGGPAFRTRSQSRSASRD